MYYTFLNLTNEFCPNEGSEGHIENDYCHVLGLEEGKIVSGTRAKFESTGEEIFTGC